MSQAAFYGAVLVGVTVGVAALLAGEFFHGVDYLIPVGGGVALLAVGALTVGVSRSEPATTGGG
jgi:cytochrome c biogenesis protein CcdA